MNYRYVLAFDPSGNYNEGKGITGWCLFDTEYSKIVKFGIIKAVNFNSQMEYWEAHLALIDGLYGFQPMIVMEDYLLYATAATAQINSRLETPKLIGMLQYESYIRGMKITFQNASAVKTRWKDNILEHKGLIQEKEDGYYIKETKLSEHCRDAIRHAVHYSTFRKE